MKDFYFSNEDDEQEFLKNQKWLIHSLIVESVKKAYNEDLEKLFNIVQENMMNLLRH